MSQVVEIPVNSAVEIDEILLETAFKENAVPQTRLIELSQVSLLKSCSVHFTLFDGHFLSVYFKPLFSKPKKYWLNLAYLEPTPRRVLKIDKPSLYATGILSALAAVFVLIHTFSNESLTLLPFTVAVICSALIAFLLLIYRSKDRIVFCSRYGRVNWLEFLINSPNRSEFRKFIKAVINAGHAVSSHQNSRHEQRLGGELREHRRLRDEGILPKKVYEDVKLRLLNEHANLSEVFIEDYDFKGKKTEISISNLKYVSNQMWTILANKITAMRKNIKKRRLHADKKITQQDRAA